MAETTQRRSTKEIQVRKNFINECRDSRIEVKARFSPNMLRIYRRHFQGVSQAAYLLRFYCRVGPGSNVERELTKEIIGLINEVKANVEKKIAVADQILKKENVKVSQSQFTEVTAMIIDPIANLFLKTLTIAQELDEKLSALWLACLLDDEQKRKAMSEIDSDLKSIQAKTRALFVGVRIRVKEMNEGRQSSGESEVIDASTDQDEGEIFDENGVIVELPEMPEQQTEKAKTKTTKVKLGESTIDETSKPISTENSEEAVA
jgi:hypothetical protein